MVIDKTTLVQAFLNQLENDIEAQDYEALDWLLQSLMTDGHSIQKFVEYLSDDERDRMFEGKTKFRYN